MLHQPIFFTSCGEAIYFCVFIAFILLKYILLGPKTGGYSDSIPYFIPGSYFSDILGFILHTVTSANQKHAIARRLSNAQIRT